jgi:hypothetical protein
VCIMHFIHLRSYVDFGILPISVYLTTGTNIFTCITLFWSFVYKISKGLSKDCGPSHDTVYSAVVFPT